MQKILENSRVSLEEIPERTLNTPDEPLVTRKKIRVESKPELISPPPALSNDNGRLNELKLDR